MILFLSGLISCVPLLTHKKSISSASLSEQPKLVKPKISEKEETLDQIKTSESKLNATKSSASGFNFLAEKDDKEKDDKEKNEKKKENDSGTPVDDKKRVKSDYPVDQKPNRLGLGEDAQKLQTTDEISFKKHNHSKYKEKIKNKAIDMVNRDGTAKLVRICQNKMTEEWSLTFFYSDEKHYWFTSYIWDEIDEKWQQSFVSDKKPVAGLKHHLDFSAAGKDCRILKGRR